MSNRHHIRLFSVLLLAACQLAIADGQETEKRQEGQSAEKKFTMTFETTKPRDYCKSSTSIEYQQRNDVAHVTGEINVEGCTKASGGYTISIRVRDDNGETLNTDFEETWDRSDDQPIVFAKDYDIGNNVGLIRARVRRSSCICSDSVGDDSEN